MKTLGPIILVVLALFTLVAAALIQRIPPDVEVETVPHQLNPSPADGEPASYSYVLPTTTTTAPPAPKHNLSRKTRGELFDAAMGSVNGYPCGGDLPPCRVLRCESGGDPTAENPTSSASGLWQILDSTWAGYGGYARASHAPAEVQNEKARALWANGRGASHWRSCL